MKIVQTDFTAVKSNYKALYHKLPLGFDDFYEGMIIEGDHYLVLDDFDQIACFSLDEENYMTSLVVLEMYLDKYQEIFRFITKEVNIQGVKGVSNDTFLLNEMISREYAIERQACNFRYLTKHETNLDLVLATLNDLSEIKECFEDFQSNYEELIHEKLLYLYKENEVIIAMGNMTPHLLDPSSYSLGIIVKEEYRSKKIARNVLRWMGNKLLNEGKTVNAGCWFFNEASKRALECAGFVRSNIIFNVSIKDLQNE